MASEGTSVVRGWPYDLTGVAPQPLPLLAGSPNPDGMQDCGCASASQPRPAQHSPCYDACASAEWWAFQADMNPNLCVGLDRSTSLSSPLPRHLMTMTSQSRPRPWYVPLRCTAIAIARAVRALPAWYHTAKANEMPSI